METSLANIQIPGLKLCHFNSGGTNSFLSWTALVIDRRYIGRS